MRLRQVLLLPGHDRRPRTGGAKSWPFLKALTAHRGAAGDARVIIGCTAASDPVFRRRTTCFQSLPEHLSDAARQVRRRHRRGLRQAGHLRTPAALPLWLNATARLCPAVNLDISGVQVDRDLIAQCSGAPHREQREHPRVHLTDPALERNRAPP